MARMPDYTALGAPPTPSSGGGVASYAAVDMGGEGRAVSAAGADVQEAAGYVAQSNYRQDTMVAEAALNRLQAQRLDLEAGKEGFRNVKGGNAVGQQFLDTYQQKFEDSRALIEDSLQNDTQKKLFQQRVPVAGLAYRSALLSHQATETNTFNDQTENDTIDLARRQMFQNPLDPSATQASEAQINWAIDQKAQRLGWSPEVKEQAKTRYMEKVYEDAAGVLVERDPVGSLQAMNKRLGIGEEAGDTGIAAFDKIPADKLIEHRRRAFTYVKQEAISNQAAMDKRLKDAEKETKDLLEFTLTGQMVSSGYGQQVLFKVAGTPFEEQAKQLITASYAGALHGSLPLPAQDQELRKVDAAFATSGSTPEALKVAGHMRTITENQKQAYKENPWAAGTRFGRLPDVQEMQITDASKVPQLVADRVPLMSGVEGYAGQAVSPLQPNEAKAFADRLNSLPPADRAEVLGQTGALLSAPRAAALADQLDKHDKPLALALKMGLDRTTAGRAASTYVLEGSQALADKTVKKDESALSGWRADIATLVRGTLGDDKAEQDVIDAAYYVRAAMDKDGVAPAGYKPMSASAESAIAMVIGQPVTRGGQKTLLPRGMNESDFDTKLRGYTAAKLSEQSDNGYLYVRGQPVKVDVLANRIPDAALRRDGQGRYVPSINNAPVTLDPAGQMLLRLDVR